MHGVLLLDKPLGLSSNDALQKAKRLFRAEKAGHTGTLDPLATGLLPLCFGAATKFSQVSLDADKALPRDAEAGRDHHAPATPKARSLAAARRGRDAAQMRGRLRQLHRRRSTQVPPMHSALKHEGRALYEYARAGIEIERAPRRVTHPRASTSSRGDGDRWTLDVRCSKGTYIRTLAEDIGSGARLRRAPERRCAAPAAVR